MADEATTSANRSGMDPNRLVLIFLISFALVFTLFLQHVLSLAFAQFGWGDPEVIEGTGWTLTTVLGALLAIGLAVYAWVSKKRRATGHDIASEFMKVTWPSWGETRVSTIAVVVASVVAAVILFGIDTLAYKVMVEWLPALWSRL